MSLNDSRTSAVGGNKYTPDRVSQNRHVVGDRPDKEQTKTIKELRAPCMDVGHWGPTLKPGMVAGSPPMGAAWAQPEWATLLCPPPAGGALCRVANLTSQLGLNDMILQLWHLHTIFLISLTSETLHPPKNYFCFFYFHVTRFIKKDLIKDS